MTYYYNITQLQYHTITISHNYNVTQLLHCPKNPKCFINSIFPFLQHLTIADLFIISIDMCVPEYYIIGIVCYVDLEDQMAQMVKNLPAMQETRVGSLGPVSWKTPGEGNGYSFHYSCMENPTNRGSWQAGVLGVAMSWTKLSDEQFHFHFLSLCNMRLGIYHKDLSCLFKVR